MRNEDARHLRLPRPAEENKGREVFLSAFIIHHSALIIL